MNQLGVLDRLSRHGRLRARLDAIGGEAVAGAIARMVAGDRIRDEIIAPLAEDASQQAHEIRLHAHLLRARLYTESKGATALDAAGALSASREAAAAAGQLTQWAPAAGPLARTVLDQLRAAGSRRNSLAMFRLLLEATELSPTVATTPRELLDMAPGVLQAALQSATGTECVPLLDQLARVVASHAGDDAGTRDRTRQVLFRLGLLARSAATAMSHYPGPSYATGEEIVALALLLIDAGRLDAHALAVIETALAMQPAARPRVGKALADACAPGACAGAEALADRIDVCRRVATWFAEDGWVFTQLVHLAAARGDPATAMAAFAACRARGLDGAAVSAAIARVLLDTGFASLAITIGDPMCAVLARATYALATDPTAAASNDVLLYDLDHLASDPATPTDTRCRAHRLRGRILAAGCKFSLAVGAFENALAHGEHDHSVALELATALLAIGADERARAFVDVAREVGDTARTCDLLAMLAEHGGRDGEAAQLLSDALTYDAEARSAPDIRVGLLDAAGKVWRVIEPKHKTPPDFLASLARAIKETPSPGTGRFRDARAVRRRALLLADRAGEMELVRTLGAAMQDVIADDVEVAVALGRAALVVGEVDNALAILLPHSESDALAVALVGIAHAVQQRPEQAVLALRAAVDRRVSPAASLALAVIEAVSGHEDEARRVADSALVERSLDARVAFDLLRLRASLRERGGELFGALADMVDALHIADEPELRCAYARLAIRIGLAENVDAHARAALLRRGLDAAVDPTDTATIRLFAVAEETLGLTPRAVVTEAPNLRPEPPPLPVDALMHTAALRLQRK